MPTNNQAPLVREEQAVRLLFLRSKTRDGIGAIALWQAGLGKNGQRRCGKNDKKRLYQSICPMKPTQRLCPNVISPGRHHGLVSARPGSSPFVARKPWLNLQDIVWQRCKSAWKKCCVSGFLTASWCAGDRNAASKAERRKLCRPQHLKQGRENCRSACTNAQRGKPMAANPIRDASRARKGRFFRRDEGELPRAEGEQQR